MLTSNQQNRERTIEQRMKKLTIQDARLMASAWRLGFQLSMQTIFWVWEQLVSREMTKRTFEMLQTLVRLREVRYAEC